MLNAIEISKSIKRIINRYILGIVNLTSEALIDTNYLLVESTKKYSIGEHLVIRMQDSADAELVVVSAIDGRNRLILCNNLTRNWPITSYVQKIVGYSSGSTDFLNAIYIGNPPVIKVFPAIAIDLKTRNSEWLTLESTSETYTLDIIIYSGNLASFDSSYELMHAYASSVENALFRSFYPLVEPYFYTTLAEDSPAGSVTIKVTDNEFYRCSMGTVFFENVDHTRPNRVVEDLGNGVLKLAVQQSVDFYAGDKVISPRVHVYNSLPASTTYGTVVKNNSMLKCAVVSYTCTIEQRRYNPYIDNLI